MTFFACHPLHVFPYFCRSLVAQSVGNGESQLLFRSEQPGQIKFVTRAPNIEATKGLHGSFVNSFSIGYCISKCFSRVHMPIQELVSWYWISNTKRLVLPQSSLKCTECMALTGICNGLSDTVILCICIRNRFLAFKPSSSHS